MAIGDWVRWTVNGPFTNLDSNARDGLVCAGGGAKSLRTLVSGMTGSTPAMWGYGYNGPDSGSFPLGDGTISAAFRSPTSGVSLNTLTGVYMRCSALAPSTTSQLDFYGLGVYTSGTQGGSPTLRLFRFINGSGTFIGPSYLVPVVSNSFIQFELIVRNHPANPSWVTPYLRWNTGAILQTPGGPNWTTPTLLGTDTGPSGLENPGYCGFFQWAVNPWSGGGDKVYFDHVRIGLESPV